MAQLLDRIDGGAVGGAPLRLSSQDPMPLRPCSPCRRPRGGGGGGGGGSGGCAGRVLEVGNKELLVHQGLDKMHAAFEGGDTRAEDTQVVRI
jgi:hypothetical protein